MDRPVSVYLDLVRFLAAVMVFIVHANLYRFVPGGLPLLWRLEDFGNDAVMVFFVLSGFVIAHVSSTRESTLRDYSISRLARLYSVVLPALLLTVALDYAGTRLDRAVYDGWWFQSDHPLWRIFANLFFVNELWFGSVRPFSNGPFWSMGYEAWYYVIFAAAFYFERPVGVAVAIVLGLVAGPKILILLPVWLLGVLAYEHIRTRRPSEAAGWAMFLGSAAAYVVYRVLEGPQMLLHWTFDHLGHTMTNQLGQSKYFLSSFIIGPLVAIHFVGAAAIAPRLARLATAWERPIRYLAGFTFSFYLFHFPLLQFFAAAANALHLTAARTATVLLGTIGSAWILGSLAEARKSDLRRFFAGTLAAIRRRIPVRRSA